MYTCEGGTCSWCENTYFHDLAKGTMWDAACEIFKTRPPSGQIEIPLVFHYLITRSQADVFVHRIPLSFALGR